MMKLLTHLGGATATLTPGLLLLVFGGAVRQLGLAMVVANIISHLPVQVLKRLVARARPADSNGVPLATVALPDPFSFPSGHAAAATAVAVTASLAYPWVAPLVLPLAFLVALSRVTLRVHYLSDVVAGAILGLGGALAVRSLLG